MFHLIVSDFADMENCFWEPMDPILIIPTQSRSSTYRSYDKVQKLAWIVPIATAASTVVIVPYKAMAVTPEKGIIFTLMFVE